jgi:large subunit ribosomal protein L23
MGLLDRWTKKTNKAKLTTLDKKPTKSVKKVEANTEAVVEKTKAVKSEGIAYKILVRPLVTEKSAIMESLNKYSFVVNRSATKDQIKQAVFEAYGVRPAAVNVTNVEGKNVRFGRTRGRRSDYRKAIVTLSAGQTIAIHEGV